MSPRQFSAGRSPAAVPPGLRGLFRPDDASDVRASDDVRAAIAAARGAVMAGVTPRARLPEPETEPFEQRLTKADAAILRALATATRWLTTDEMAAVTSYASSTVAVRIVILRRRGLVAQRKRRFPTGSKRKVYAGVLQGEERP